MHQVLETLTYDGVCEGMRVQVIKNGLPLCDYHRRTVHYGATGVVEAKLFGRLYIHWDCDNKGVSWFNISSDDVQFLKRICKSSNRRPK